MSAIAVVLVLSWAAVTVAPGLVAAKALAGFLLASVAVEPFFGPTWEPSHALPV